MTADSFSWKAGRPQVRSYRKLWMLIPSQGRHKGAGQGQGQPLLEAGKGLWWLRGRAPGFRDVGVTPAWAEALAWSPLAVLWRSGSGFTGAALVDESWLPPLSQIRPGHVLCPHEDPHAWKVSGQRHSLISRTRREVLCAAFGPSDKAQKAIPLEQGIDQENIQCFRVNLTKRILRPVCDSVSMALFKLWGSCWGKRRKRP